MRKNLSARAAAAYVEDITREEGWLSRFTRALHAEGIGTGYSGIHLYENGKVLVGHERRGRTYLDIQVAPGYYAIQSDDRNNYGGSESSRTPLLRDQMEIVTGATSHYNSFLGALEYILAAHMPTAVRSGKLQEVVAKFKRPEPKPEVTAEDLAVSDCLAEGDDLTKVKKFADAEVHYAKGLKRWPHRLEIERRYIVSLLSQDKFEEIAAHMGDMTEAMTSDPQLLWIRGKAYGKMGHPDDAIRLARRALEKHSNRDMLLAEVLYNNGEAKQARDTIQNVLASDPENAAAHLHMGELLLLDGQERDAEEHFIRALFAPSKKTADWISEKVRGRLTDLYLNRAVRKQGKVMGETSPDPAFS